MMNYECRVPNFKKSMIFLKIRGSSKKDDPPIDGFCFFGKAGLMSSFRGVLAAPSGDAVRCAERGRSKPAELG